MRRTHPRGFTLIERLVVIGLVMVLMAIAVPMMAAYVERARAASCLSNRCHTDNLNLLQK